MKRGRSQLVLYWDRECKKPIERMPSDEPVDLGETILDGDKKVIEFFLKNEGDRTFYLTNIQTTKRPDLKINFEVTKIRPNQVIPVYLEWDTARAVDDLKFEFLLDGKFYPFGD